MTGEQASELRCMSESARQQLVGTAFACRPRSWSRHPCRYRTGAGPGPADDSRAAVVTQWPRASRLTNFRIASPQPVLSGLAQPLGNGIKVTVKERAVHV
jgi:hypothetical protein